MEKRSVITIIIVLAIIIVAILVLTRSHPDVSEKISKCIGENSVLYVQTGCHVCEAQKEIFGDNYQYLDIVDCWVERDKCPDIRATPTWVIDGQQYLGKMTIDELKELTGC